MRRTRLLPVSSAGHSLSHHCYPFASAPASLYRDGTTCPPELPRSLQIRSALIRRLSHCSGYLDTLAAMDTAPDTSFGHFENAGQIAFWHGSGGRRWVERQAALDALLAPINELLMDRAAIQRGERVVDIGCGCGATTIAAAEKVGPDGSVLGID